jgi:hypothetical protein
MELIMKINPKIMRRMVLFLMLGILSIFCTPKMLRGQSLEIKQNDALNIYKKEFPYEDTYFTSKMIRGQKLINEIDNYYIINNDYPKFLSSLEQADHENLLNIYKKAFPNEEVRIGGFTQQYTQPYYQEMNFQPKYYQIYYKIGWSKKHLWDWIFMYDSRVKMWEISYMQY